MNCMRLVKRTRHFIKRYTLTRLLLRVKHNLFRLFFFVGTLTKLLLEINCVVEKKFFSYHYFLEKNIY